MKIYKSLFFIGLLVFSSEIYASLNDDIKNLKQDVRNVYEIRKTHKSFANLDGAITRLKNSIEKAKQTLSEK